MGKNARLWGPHRLANEANWENLMKTMFEDERATER